MNNKRFENDEKLNYIYEVLNKTKFRNYIYSYDEKVNYCDYIDEYETAIDDRNNKIAKLEQALDEIENILNGVCEMASYSKSMCLYEEDIEDIEKIIQKTNVGSFIDDNYDINGKQYKASYNIIDLIEVGDYVNGLKVIDIVENDIYVSDYYAESCIGIVKVKDIKSIVTHEQMEQISYRIGDNK